MRLLLLTLPATLAAALFAACGGSNAIDFSAPDGGKDSAGGGGSGTLGTDDSGTGSLDSGTDAPTDATPTDCPFAPPTNGAACTHEITCTYGSDPRFSCRPQAQCSKGSWLVTNLSCAPPPTCPASPSPDTTCTPSGFTCGYPDTTCTCQSCFVVCQEKATFHCNAPPKGCPSAPPNLGTACTSEGTSCDYGACNGGTAMKCTDGVWQRTFTACPVTSG